MLNSINIKSTVSKQLSAHWEPTSYMKFLDYRIRPAEELLMNIQLEEPRTIVDLGCGPGHLTKLMAKKWPSANFVGIDSSKEMIEKAKETQCKQFNWLQTDLKSWQPSHKVDLIFANSFFHLMEHCDFIHKLFSNVNHGGVVAIQMPVCRDTKWYQLMLDVLQLKNDQGVMFGDQYLLSNIDRNFVMDKEYYYSILKNYCTKLNIWDTEYLQELEGENPVFEWVRAAGLKPVITNLTKENASQFISIYQSKLLDYYPKDSNNKTLFPFKRRFIVATVK